MSYCFGDSFDLYAAPADAVATYWDSGAGSNWTLVAGRFSGGQAFQTALAGTIGLVKSSGSNDAIHHVVMAFRQTLVLSGTTLGMYLTFGDGATAQCSIVLRSDGAILLTSGGPAGTVLATWTGGVTAQNAWIAYEFEVVINNTTGSISARRNGSTSNDFTLGSLNTRGGTANNYASRLTIGMQSAVNAQQIDDVLWRSDASSVPWVGDIRAYVRMPASDASVQFSRSGAGVLSQTIGSSTSVNTNIGTMRLTQFTVNTAGTISTISFASNAGMTGNIKGAIWADAAGVPGAVLGSAPSQAVVAGGAGTNAMTLTSGVSVAAGQKIWVGACVDTTTGSWATSGSSVSTGAVAMGSFAAFPQASPVVTIPTQMVGSSIIYNVSGNAALVAEAQQDGAATYVYDSVVGHADLYGIAPLAVTPASVIAVTTRAFIQKSDAGSRSGAVQLKSGATTVASTTTALSTTFAWLYRTDTTDPATGSAWTTTAVNNVQVGPLLVV